MKYCFIIFLCATHFIFSEQFSVIQKNNFEIFRKIVERNECEILNVQILDYEIDGFLLITCK